MMQYGAISFFILLLMAAAILPPSEMGSTAASLAIPPLRTAPPARTDQLQLTGIQLLFKGQPVDQLVTGAKAKKYSVNLTGTGFDPSSQVFIAERKVPTTFESSTQLTARLRGGLLAAPGELFIQVMNSDGQVSNTLPMDVISNPSDLSITSLSPDFGQVGAQIKLTGRGFMPTGNRLRFRKVVPPGFEGVTMELPSVDGQTMTFNIPSSVCPLCAYSTPPCLAPCYQIAPGDYLVAVINAQGMSNSLAFLVSSPNGPLGVWGGDNIRFQVSDQGGRVDGLCFSGVIEHALQPDAAGNFDVAGLYYPEVGPIGAGRPAHFSGTINDSVMTLIIKVTDSQSSLGPYTLTFGKDVQIVKPCV